MDRETRHAYHGAFGEVFAADVEPTFRDDTRETQGRGGVDAKRLIDARIEVGQLLHLIRSCDGEIFGTEMFIEVRLQLALDVRVACEVVYDGAGGAARGG